MQRLALIICITVTLLGARTGRAQTTAPATGPSTNPTESLEDTKALERKRWEEQFAPLDKLEPKTLAELFSLTLENGELMFKPKLGATYGPHRIELRDFPGLCTVDVRADDPAQLETTYAFTMKVRDFSRVDEIWRDTDLFATPTNLQIARLVNGAGENGMTVQLVQSPENAEPEQAIRLSVQMLSGDQSVDAKQKTYAAADFAHLRRNFPLETQVYLAPVLRDLKCEAELLAPDARVAYQVFVEESSSDPALVARVNAAIDKFDAENFRERDAAAKALREIGQPAAIVLMHADRKGWSTDKSSGVDSFLQEYQQLQNAQARDFGSNAAFLLDCLYSSDVQIRKFAAKRLEKLSGHPVPFDINAELPARVLGISKLYPQLVKPAETKNDK